ncbi:membrane protein of ER body-like protein isoform X2 [Abrus precatorius]|uniref:Membrane protein of ER body-like protein isoform X2 n=1 Tax=Abrus precatorius TaxID=3816 RepID=A0A8B8JNX9_ABRPR|nr:membrane protein of ER body-like protein isoform X2 [Abrus precatorius]
MLRASFKSSESRNFVTFYVPSSSSVSMEQVHHHWVLEDEEEEEQQQLQEDTALDPRKPLHVRNDIIIASDVASSAPFINIGDGDDSASMEEQPLLQKEEECHTHQDEQKKGATQKEEEVEETSDSNVIGNNNRSNDDIATVFVENEINEEATNNDAINVAAPQNENIVYFDKQQELSPLHKSSEVQATTVENFGDDISSISYPNLTEEIDQQLKGFDVEAVLAKQETHDLFCPNCKSCITKRVILMKRKRTIPNLDTKAKRDKSETELVGSSVHEANQGVPAVATSDVGRVEPPADNYEPEREPEVFRCLSCFSFFIPMRNGIKLFPSFGGTREPEISPNPSVIPASNIESPSTVAAFNANWLFTLFTSNKGEKTSGQGDASIVARSDPAEQLQSSSSTNVPTSSGIGDPESPFADTDTTKEAKPTPDTEPGQGGVSSLIPSKVKQEKFESLIENGKSSKALGNEPFVDQNGLQKVIRDFIDFPAREQILTENVRTDVEEKKHASVDMIKTDISKPGSVPLATVPATEIDFSSGKPAKDAIVKPYDEGPPILEKSQKDADKAPKIAQDSYSSLMEEARSPAPSSGTSAVSNDVASDKQSSEVDFSCGKPAKDAIVKPYDEGSPILEKSQKDVDKAPKIAHDSYSSLMEEARSPAPSSGTSVVSNDVACDKQSSEVNVTIPSDQEFRNVQEDIEEEINRVSEEKKVEAEAVRSSTSQTADNVPVEEAVVTKTQTQIDVEEQPRAEIGEPQGLEVVKSIVYGGLIESITSLGIVSSAAGSDAAPLSIIALGLANLISGLFVIGHNLIELKNDNSEGNSQQEDRYQQLLGRRSNFLLHAVVAVLSFVIFGSVPLVVYGLLISDQFYAEVKIAVVAVASVVCIIVLTVGKVYCTTTTHKSYIKTVLKYVGIALGASGITYIAGDLLKRLLDKFSGTESGFVLAMPLSGTRKMKPAWMSY